MPRVLDRVNARWLDFDLFESRGAELRAIIGFIQRSGNASHPQLHISADISRHGAAYVNWASS